MPVYLYRCVDCGAESDRHHSFDATVTDLCQCGGGLRRVITLAGVSFKGNGFYRTDNTETPKEK